MDTLFFTYLKLVSPNRWIMSEYFAFLLYESNLIIIQLSTPSDAAMCLKNHNDFIG
jgi:hypothetical protein